MIRDFFLVLSIFRDEWRRSRLARRAGDYESAREFHAPDSILDAPQDPRVEPAEFCGVESIRLDFGSQPVANFRGGRGA